ncbi:PALMITOYL-PROTEIN THIOESTERASE/DOLICHYLDIPHOSPHATASE 1 [Salix viminalis]|uniref:PALMITOYL-PROTEIN THIOESTERASE/DOLICHYLDIPHOSPHATASE 1 n=1 Tax=Salix viminalis TaxID=40686 RepID=A0A9Q0NZ85_SALVM|nr:PALMITOYL-PROTEIN THIOESTERASE/DOLICHYLDIPHOSPHATASE 1 [Salix viminalis]
MMSVPAILHKPSFKSLPFCPFKLSQAKPISFLPFPASKSDFFGSKNQALSRNMTELVRMSTFRDSNGSDSDESTRLFQQEAVFDGPNEFQSGLLADGLEATLNRLSKWLVAVLFGTVILWRHDAEAMWAVMGSIVNSILSVILKRIFNQERPDSTLRSDPGMPSSHGQSIFFTVVFAILSGVLCMSVFDLNECSLGANEFALILSAFILVFGTYLTWLRVSQGLHTISQVAVGAAVGSIFSIFWFWSWDSFVHKAFISSLSVRIIVVMGAAASCLGFLVYVIRDWFRDE